MSNWTPKVGMVVKKVGGPTGNGRCPIGYTTTITELGPFSDTFEVTTLDGRKWGSNAIYWKPVRIAELDCPSYNSLYE